MIHKISSDRVVLIHGKCDFQFRADAIDARHQDRRAHIAKIWSKQSSEPAGFSKHLRSVCSPDETMNVALKLISQVNVDTSGGIGFSSCHALGRGGSPNRPRAFDSFVMSSEAETSLILSNK